MNGVATPVGGGVGVFQDNLYQVSDRRGHQSLANQGN